MEGPSPQEHLKIAKRLHFQGRTDDAISEYELVLELDPENEDAMNGLRALGVEPKVAAARTGAVEHAGGLKTDFFAKQAKDAHSSPLKANLFRIVVLALGLGTAYGIYVFTMYMLNFDDIKAMENVEVSFERPLIKDNQAQVNVKVANFNPSPIKKMVVGYTITDVGGTALKEGTIKLDAAVPPGDSRTFEAVPLGEINGKPAKLKPRMESLKYGPKSKLKEKLISRFIDACSHKDKESLRYYEELLVDVDDFAPIYIGLGRALAAHGKWDDAIKEYKKALDLEPDNYNAHYYSAVAYYYKNDRKTAKVEMDKAAQLAPDDPEIAWNMKYLFSLKDQSAAMLKQEREAQKGKAEKAKP